MYITKCMHNVLALTVCSILYTGDMQDTQAEKEIEPVAPYALLASYGTQRNSSVISDQSKDEIEYWNLLHSIDYSTTQFGLWGYEFLIQPQPRKHIDTTYSIQESIKTLVQQPEIRKHIQTILNEIKASEEHLLSYFQSHSELEEEIGNELYYNKLGYYFPQLNYSPTALEFGIHSGPMVGVCGHILAAIAPSIIINSHIYQNRVFTDLQELSESSDTASENMQAKLAVFTPQWNEVKDAVTKGVSHYATTRSPLPNTFSNPDIKERCFHEIDTSPSFAGAFNTSIYYHSGINTPSCGDTYIYATKLCNSHVIGVLTCLGSLWSDLYQSYCIYQNVQEISERYDTVKKLHTPLCHIAHIVKKMRELHEIVTTYFPERLSDELPHSSFITHTDYENQQIEDLDHLLSSKTFSQLSSVYSRGKTLATHQSLKNNTQSCIPWMQYIGAIDALAGLAEMYVDSEDTAAPFCFADIDSTHIDPYMQLTEFWSPLIPSHPITNNITIDRSNIILTGPNGIGKSTAMKGITHSILLAQSIGIAPACNAHITPYDYINTYLNIREDIQNGLSSFMAEKKRIDEFYAEIPSLSHNALYLVDEPFRGTYAEEAENRVYQFGSFIDQHPHTTLLLATHFEKPTHLSNEHRFANYHLDVQEYADARFTLTHKLQPGILNWWFDDPEKRARFIDWIGDYTQACATEHAAA